MPKTSVEVSQPICLLINHQNKLASQLRGAIESFGFKVETAPLPSQDIFYAIWIEESAKDVIRQWPSVINESISHQVKMLILAPAGLAEDTQQINHLLNQVTGDVRVILYDGLYGLPDQTPQSLEDKLTLPLERGEVNDLTHESFYPISIDALKSEIMSLWLDRGHRHQIVGIRGKRVSGTELYSELLQCCPKLVTSTPLQCLRSDFNEVGELREIPEISGQFINFLVSKVTYNKSTHGAPPVTKPLYETMVIPEEMAPPSKQPAEPIVAAPVRQVVVPKSISKTKPSSVSSRSSWFLRLVVFILALMVVGSVVGGGLMYKRHQINGLTVNQPITHLQQQKTEIEAVSSFVSTWLTPISFVPAVQQQVSRQISQAQQHILWIKAQREMVTAAKHMVTAAEGDPYEPLRQAKQDLDELYLLQSTSNVPSVDRQKTLKLRAVADALPNIIPSDKKINLLLLLQNNLELRPTGGFIGAVAILTFDHGKLLDTQIRDIYDLDANLKGVANPPPDLKTYLGESAWYFRDANWSPDFRDTAKVTSWFLEKEWGSPADVVVGINLNTLAFILEQLGPITLPNGQTITATNLESTAFNYQDVPAVKPELKKQEFISLFIKPLLDKISQAEPAEVVKIFQAIDQALQSGDVQIAASDQAAESQLIGNEWGGTIEPVLCNNRWPAPCDSDSFYLNEANVGINKANFYVSRTQKHNFNLEVNSVKHNHQTTISNSSPNEAWPAGSYKTFVRAYVPKTAANVSLTIDDQPVSATAYSVKLVDLYQVIGFYLEVKPQNRRAFTVSYSVPLDPASKTYIWSMPKQAGILGDPFDFNVQAGLSRRLGRTTSSLTTGSTESLSGPFNKSAVITIELSQ